MVAANALGPELSVLALKLHLRRHLRCGELSAVEANAVQALLNDESKVQDLAATLGDYADLTGQNDLLASMDGPTPPAAPQRPIGRFLQWLWDNRQQILQFVLLIVGLFGGTVPTIPGVSGATAQAVEHAPSEAAIGKYAAVLGPVALLADIKARADDLNNEVCGFRARIAELESSLKIA